MPTFGSLFAGIGGIDLGLERAGWTGRWQVEWDAYCQRVLAKHWPDIPRYGDITTVDWSSVEPVDLIAGGFPCQPFSLAGQRRGKADDRWLWPAFAAAIRALRPRYILVENVPGLLAGHGGMGAVLGDLADLGYDAEWDCIPAAAVGAPHLRYRVWIVAHAHDLGGFRFGGLFNGVGSPFGDDADRCDRAFPDADGDEHEGGPSTIGWPATTDVLEDAYGGTVEPRRGRRGTPEASELADATSNRREPRRPRDPAQEPGGREPSRGGVGPDRLAHTASIGGGALGADGDGSRWADGTLRGSRYWATEPDVGRVAHGVPARVDRLRSLGNAVVPQVVEVIGRRLLDLA